MSEQLVGDRRECFFGCTKHTRPHAIALHCTRGITNNFVLFSATTNHVSCLWLGLMPIHICIFCNYLLWASIGSSGPMSTTSSAYIHTTVSNCANGEPFPRCVMVCVLYGSAHAILHSCTAVFVAAQRKSQRIFSMTRSPQVQASRNKHTAKVSSVSLPRQLFACVLWCNWNFALIVFCICRQ